MDKMTVDQFILSEVKFLIEFGRYWQGNREKNLESFPAIMSQEEWVEQIHSFATTKEDAK